MDILYCLRGKCFNSLFISLFRCLFHIPNNNYNPFPLFLTPASLHILLCLSKCILHLDAHSKTQYEKNNQAKMWGNTWAPSFCFCWGRGDSAARVCPLSCHMHCSHQDFGSKPPVMICSSCSDYKAFLCPPKVQGLGGRERGTASCCCSGRKLPILLIPDSAKVLNMVFEQDLWLKLREKPHRKQQKWLWTHLWV